MSATDREQRIAQLQNVIDQIERKPALAQARQSIEVENGFPPLPGGLLQEIFTDEQRNSGVTLGFGLAQAKRLLQSRRLAVIYLQLAREGQTLGLPYGPGLLSFGFDPAAMVVVRAGNMLEMLWAAEQALSCTAVAAVIADIGSSSKLLDFTASRRLSLRAAEMGTSIFMLRYGTGREASAAHLRWRLVPEKSGRKPFDDKAPGLPRWEAQLERGALIKQHTRWLLEWSKDGFATLSAPNHSLEQASGSSISRALLAPLGDRLSQTA